MSEALGSLLAVCLLPNYTTFKQIDIQLALKDMFDVLLLYIFLIV